MAEVVNLAAARQRKLARESAAARPEPALRQAYPAYIAAEADRVILRLTNGDELDLSPDHARVWAERLVAMADTAEALGKEGGDRG